MKKCDVAIVVLHYESLVDTVQCLDSLIKYINKNKFRIIVVDNGSKVGKISKIENNYSQLNQIEFIRSELNLGFAKGNNIGFKYAKENYNPEVIVLANNDLIFSQENFIDKLLNNYNQLKFDVAGPKIISLVDGKNQNPTKLMYNTPLLVFKRIIKYKILYFLSFLNGLDIVIQRKVSKPIEEYEYKESEDFQLHGACMFFGQRFIAKFDGLYPDTFMYGEEFILKYFCRLHKLSMKYIDSLIVYHKEGSSTQSVYGKGIKQRQFFYKWNIDSFKKLLKMMKEGV